MGRTDGCEDANDELMRASVQFFREGPNAKVFGYRPDPLDRTVLIHEMSSCEPCYSRNIFRSWQLGDRDRFLEGLYSLFVGALSTQTYISCEHRHGVQGNIFATPTAFALARLSVIDDEIVPGELHLLRLCPNAWITGNGEAVFEKMPTVCGPIDSRFKRADRSVLDVNFSGRWREKPKRVMVHLPQQAGISRVRVNGKLQPSLRTIEIN